MAVSDFTDEFGSNDGLNDIHIGTEFAQTFHVIDDVVVIHDIGLVTVDDDPLTFVVPANDSDTVGIGVRSDNEVSAEFGTECDTHRHCLSVFGVR